MVAVIENVTLKDNDHYNIEEAFSWHYVQLECCFRRRTLLDEVSQCLETLVAEPRKIELLSDPKHMPLSLGIKL